MADPITIDCSSACTVTVVHELSIPPLQLDVDGAAQVAAAILLVWAAGWVFRIFVRAIRDTDGNTVEEEK